MPLVTTDVLLSIANTLLLYCHRFWNKITEKPIHHTLHHKVESKSEPGYNGFHYCINHIIIFALLSKLRQNNSVLFVNYDCKNANFDPFSHQASGVFTPVSSQLIANHFVAVEKTNTVHLQFKYKVVSLVSQKTQNHFENANTLKRFMFRVLIYIVCKKHHLFTGDLFDEITD